MLNLMRIPGRVHFVFVRDRSGATTVEYGLLAAGISVAIIATVFLLADELNALFANISGELKVEE